MIVHTIASTLPALFAKYDMHGKAETEMNNAINDAMNIILGPNLFSSRERMKICTSAADNPREPMITPI